MKKSNKAIKHSALVAFLGALISVVPAECQSYVIGTVAGGSPPVTPALARSVTLPFALVSIPSVAADDYGNFYFTFGNSMFKVNTAGIMTRIAGKSEATGYSGDGGLATEASFNNLSYYIAPSGIAVDAATNVYIADVANNRVRKVTASTGIVTTVAGNGTAGYSGDGVAATAAELSGPVGIAVDASGNLYIADNGNSRIRKVAATTGIITTVAGNGSCCDSGDGGPATSASLSPYSVALDRAGNLYISELFSVRKVTAATGIITTIAGNYMTGGYSGDGGPATRAQLFNPESIAVDSAGNLYIADQANYRVRKVTAATGIITTVAGGGGFYQQDGVPATNSSLVSPSGVALSASGILYIADSRRVRAVTLADGIIQTVAGGGANLGDGGQAGNAQLSYPQNLAMDGSGNLYIADSGNNCVRKLNLATGIITTVAGNGIPTYSGDGIRATSASLNTPSGVAVDHDGNLYINDQYSFRIRKVSASGIISTVAGNGVAGDSGDGGPATSAQIWAGYGIAVDTAGNLYICDVGNNRIRKVTTATGIITTVAGNGTRGFSGDGSLATNAELSFPGAVTMDGAGNLYISDASNYRVRKVTAATGIITTIAGNGLATSTGDGGTATNAGLGPVAGITFDNSGNLIIVNYQGVRKINAATGIITTLAGVPQDGYSGDGGPATAAQFTGPWGVAVDGAGNIYVTDGYNNAIRMLAPPSNPLLSVTKTHQANFVQGQTNARFSVVVANAIGAGPTSGMVTVSEIVPVGVTSIAMFGAGWNCPQPGSTCTRTDSLNGGSSYPPITLSVNVGPNSPSQFTNQVGLTGGSSVAMSTSDAVNVVGSPAMVRLATQPSDGAVGGTLPSVTVLLEDVNGFLEAGATTFISLASNPPGVSGTLNAVNGVASFNNLVFNTPGTYTLTASSSGLTSATSSSFTIAAVNPAAPTVVIDSPTAGTVVATGTVIVSGWALDNITAAGTAISNVQVKVDGVAIGNAAYGSSRSDACNAFPGRPGCPHVGYQYSVSLALLSPGTHTITVTAIDSDPTPNAASASVNVTVAALAMSSSRVGVFRAGSQFLLDVNGNGSFDGPDRFVNTFLPPGGFLDGDLVVTGDWNGDGKTKVGYYRPSAGTWWLDANNDGVFGPGDYTYSFGGVPGDLPMVGNWNAVAGVSGPKSCIGIYRSQGSVWLLDLNCNGTFDNTPTDAFFPFGGLAGDVPVVGNFTGGTTRVGVVRKYAPAGVPQGEPFFWVYDAGNANAGNFPANHPTAGDAAFPFGGLAGDQFVTGDWLGTGTARAGVFRNGLWVLDANGVHNPDLILSYGGVATDKPITGKW